MSVLSSRLTSHPKLFFSKLAIFVVKFSIIKGFFFLILLFFMQDYCVPVISDCFYVEEEKK